MDYRTEKDTLGEVRVSVDCYYGAQTKRSYDNFSIGIEKMPKEVIHALALIKKAAALTNEQLGLLPKNKQLVICEVCDEILSGCLDDQFPLSVWQTGSGTQTNMNLNEVISNRAIEKLGGVLGSKYPIHPNDDVNLSQSSNDVFPSAMHIAVMFDISKKLLPSLRELKETLEAKVEAFKDIVKIGRTHLMDATPLTLGQEFSGYVSQIEHGIQALKNTFAHLSELALGATAVGTGMNTHPNYAKLVAEKISELSGFNFVTARNKFESLATNDALVEVSGALKRVAVSVFKIANDIRWLSSGPRCAIGEIVIPANEPGSSIMPGKVNPTQSEALMMIAIQVMGNDGIIGFAGSQGNLELNVFRPLIIYNLIQSIRLLSDAITNFNQKCVVGIEANQTRIAEHLNRSLMLATALNHAIGYDHASQIVKKAYLENITLKEATLALAFLTEDEFDQIMDPKKMIGPMT
ncbi:class II fumarate hydratase [Candidatus Protochlamydia sp. R18]|uniref:class II fumarate hydratase n=1 Tax=Candidatus Protochlamydia sp. R18 TaxID=1353977 RepID=UPI0005A5EA1E|nr:class II fumarate hydratase [Candidatus Protochlamydia sp. R18]